MAAPSLPLAWSLLEALLERISADPVDQSTLAFVRQGISIEIRSGEVTIRPKPKWLAARPGTSHERLSLSRYETAIYRPLLEAANALSRAAVALFGGRLTLLLCLTPGEVMLDSFTFDRQRLLERQAPLGEVGPLLARIDAGFRALPAFPPLAIPGYAIADTMAYTLCCSFSALPTEPLPRPYRDLAERGEIVAKSPREALAVFSVLARAICGLEADVPLPGLKGAPQVRLQVRLRLDETPAD